MWCTRIYKNDNTNRIERIRLFDETSCIFQEFTPDEVKKVLRVQPNIVTNLSLDSYGKLKLLDMNNNRMRYHSKTYLANELVAYHYAIIVGHRGGLLKVIADSYYADSIALNEVTLSTLLDRLRINETIEHFKIYNGFLEKENGKLNIYYNNGRSLVKIPSLNDTINSKVENTIDNNIWNYEISKITSEGIFLDYIEAIDDINTIKLPNGVFALHEFGGGVAHLKMCDSLEILGDGCFEELEDIYKITFSPAIKIIPERCFYRSSLQEVSFSGYEEEIKPYAFSQTNISCSIITNARTIGEYAFEGIASKVVKLPKVQVINDDAFNYSKIQKIEFGDKLRVIGKDAFFNNTNLKEIGFKSKVIIHERAFVGCPRLKEVKIPKGSRIHKDAFDKRCKIILI